MKFATYENDTEYTALRDAIDRHVLYIDGARTIRVLDAVVFHLDQFTPNRPHRTVVLRMNMLDKKSDTERMRRFVRRLSKIGIGFNTRPVETFGTVFMHSLSAF